MSALEGTKESCVLSIPGEATIAKAGSKKRRFRNRRNQCEDHERQVVLLSVLRQFNIHKSLVETEDQIQDKPGAPSPTMLMLWG